MTESTPKRDKKYVIPDKNACKRYVMFCGKVSQVGESSITVDIPKKSFPIVVSIDDFVEDIPVEEGDLVGVHYWTLPNGESGKCAELMKPNNEQSYFLRKIRQEKQDTVKGYSGTFPPKDTSISPGYNGSTKNKTEWKDIFEMAKEHFEKKK